MQRSSSTCSAGIWLLGACLLATLLGCGREEYIRLANRRLGTARGEAKFRMLFGATQLPDTPIKIRVPMIFAKSYVADSPHPDDGEKINPDRLEPPFLKLPGFKICYEGVEAGPQGQKLPFYCYLAAVPAASGDTEKLLAKLHADLKEKFKDLAADWEAVDADSPSGIAVQWKRIRIEAEQPFFVKAEEKVEAKNLLGIFELWVCDKGGYDVIVGWRAPKEIEGPASAPAAAAKKGTPAPAAPEAAPTKPDFQTMPSLTAGTITVASDAAQPATTE